MLFNFFKRKPKEKKEPEILSSAKELLSRTKDAPVKEEQKEQTPKATPAKKLRRKRKTVLPGILSNPHITEKATFLGEKGQYVFRVHQGATKGAVKQSVESLYGVEVRNVRLIKKPAKKIRIGRREGQKPGLKKAVVQLKTGQTIEVISR